mmetsp:Transcript_4061/g.7813  ORF Transcript_4061/g.7813 Transcript_4061/m.7813 type:complete len:97 (-) Transcript_4061:3-293(-)
MVFRCSPVPKALRSDLKGESNHVDFDHPSIGVEAELGGCMFHLWNMSHTPLATGIWNGSSPGLILRRGLPPCPSPASSSPMLTMHSENASPKLKLV